MDKCFRPSFLIFICNTLWATIAAAEPLAIFIFYESQKYDFVIYCCCLFTAVCGLQAVRLGMDPNNNVGIRSHCMSYNWPRTSAIHSPSKRSNQCQEEQSDKQWFDSRCTAVCQKIEPCDLRVRWSRYLHMLPYGIFCLSSFHSFS